MSREAPGLAMPALALSVLYALVVIGVMVVILAALYRIPSGHSTSVRELFRLTRFLELTTVLVIIISATFLAVLKLLTSEGVAAILGGIAGYVLGGRTASQQGEDSQPPKSSALACLIPCLARVAFLPGRFCQVNCEVMKSPMFAPAGFGVAATPWGAVQRAWMATKSEQAQMGYVASPFYKAIED